MKITVNIEDEQTSFKNFFEMNISSEQLLTIHKAIGSFFQQQQDDLFDEVEITPPVDENVPEFPEDVDLSSIDEVETIPPVEEEPVENENTSNNNNNPPVTSIPVIHDFLDIPDVKEKTVYKCSNDLEVRNAFKNIVPGDVIELSPGKYGHIYIKGGPAGPGNYGQFKCGIYGVANDKFTFPAMDYKKGEYVTFRSADVDNPATVKRIQVLSASCFRFENINVENPQVQSAVIFTGDHCRFYGTKKYAIPNDPASNQPRTYRPHITYDPTMVDYKNWTAAEWKAKTDLAISLSGEGHYVTHCNFIAVQQAVHLIESTGGSDYSVVRDVSVDGFAGDVFRGNGDHCLFEDCWVRNGYNNDSKDHYDCFQIANSTKVYKDGILRNSLFIGWDKNHGSKNFDSYVIDYWNPKKYYKKDDYAYGSDNRVYKAFSSSGVLGNVSNIQDPTLDTPGVYWVIPNAIPTVEQGVWASDDPENYIVQDNVFLLGGYQGANLNRGSNNIFDRNTLQFIAPPPGYVPPARVFDVKDTRPTIETRINDSRKGSSCWSSVSQNMYDNNSSNQDNGDNEVVRHLDWSNWYVDALRERDFHLLENAPNQNVGPIWLRYNSKKSGVGNGVFIVSPLCNSVDARNISVQLRVDLGLENLTDVLTHDVDTLKLSVTQTGKLILCVKGTNYVGKDNDVSKGMHTIKLIAGTNDVSVLVDGVVKIQTSLTSVFNLYGNSPIRFFGGSFDCSFDLNYIWVWYAADSSGDVPWQKPDKMIFGTNADVNRDAWVVGDFL